MSIIFTGFYGQCNTGDDAFCVVSDWAAKKFWNQKKVKFLGRNLPLDNRGRKLASSIPNEYYFRGQSYIELSIQGLIGSNIIYSGGSLFHSKSLGFTKEAVFKAYHKLNLIKLGAIGVSLGPFKSSSSQSAIRDYLSRFSFLALRDKRSYEEALEMDIDIPIIEAFDLAALLPLIYPQSVDIYEKQDDPIIGVSICNYESFTNGDIEQENRRFSKIVTCLNLLGSVGERFRIRILVFNGNPIHGDTELSEKLRSSIKDKHHSVEVIYYNTNPYIMWKSIGECRVVLATRLHAGIFSFFNRTPFIQVEYHKKCGDFLADIEYDNNLRIGDFEVSPAFVSNKLLELISQRRTYSNRIDNLSKKAQLNFSTFSEYF